MNDPSQEERSDSEDSGDSSWLLHQWIVAGIVSASARFIPVPWVDDIVRRRCRKFVVARTLAAHDRSSLIKEIDPYIGGQGGCVGGCLASVASAPLKLVLFPIRKFIVIFTSVHGVPLEVIRTVLLGRTLDRQLKRGTIDRDWAAQARVAFDEAFSHMDWHIARAGIRDALRSVSGWRASAAETGRSLAEKNSANPVVLARDSAVESSATKVQESLDQPEMLELFAQFDTRFDCCLAQRGSSSI